MQNVQYLSLAVTACIAFGIFYGSVTGSETRLLDMPFDWKAAGAGAVGFVVIEIGFRLFAARSKGKGDDGEA